MNKFSKWSLVLGLAMVATTLASTQELHIYYNLHNDELTYKKEGNTLKKPVVKHGDEVVLHLTELNTFLYRAEISISQEQAYVQSGVSTDASLMSGLLPGMPTPGFSGLGLEGAASIGGSGLLNIPLLKINDSPISLMSLFGGSRGSAEMLQQLESTTAEVTALLVEMETTASQIRALQNTSLVSQTAIHNVEVLKNHPNLTPTYIKERCKEYYELVFRKNFSEGAKLNDVLQLQNDALRLASLQSDLKTHQNSLSTKLNTLDLLARQLQNLEMEDQAYRRYTGQLKDFLNKSTQVNQKVAGAVSEMEQPGATLSLAALTNLQLNLVEIIENDFAHHTRFQVTGDHVNININLLEKISATETNPTPLKSRTLKLQARGGLKITGSVGLNFSQYLDPAQDYSVSNGVIVGEDAGSFMPTITSFLHFYSYSGKKVSLGGSFGIGFPLAATGSTQSLQFFAGPSLIFGTSQRILLNFGMMGGQVARLSRGFKVGDEFDVNLGDIPTRNPYQLGAYIGASFNLSGK